MVCIGWSLDNWQVAHLPTAFSFSGLLENGRVVIGIAVGHALLLLV